MESKIKPSVNFTRQSIYSRLNSFAAFLLAAILLTSATFVRASNPTSGTIAPTVGASVSWNGTAPGGASPEGETTCVQGTNCDAFTLTVSGSPADWAGKLIKVKIAWNLPASDYDFYIHKDSLTGPETDRSGEAPPVISETADIDPSTTGTGVYVINVVYYAASGNADQFRGSATVENKPMVGIETPTPSTATPPTYDNFVPPSTLGQRAGEPTVGLNFATGRAMFIASLQTLRVTFNDAVSPATATWENKSAPNTSVTSFDPILFTDSQTNRTFVSQLLPTKVSLMSFTDDDGETWTPSQGSGINSGVDHQTVGGGPYARNADGSLKGGAVQTPGADGRIYPNAVYYASQDIGVAEIARSDNGGLTFGVAVPMYDITQCGGLHGQIKVAPDGTVYVPNKSCGGQQAVAVSEDNGLTWQIRKVPGSTSGRTDPSVGIGSDGTIYLGYANGDGTPRIVVSRDRGRTWENDQNVGFFAGIKNTVFPAVTAGDGDRASYFFLGSTTGGSAGTGTDQTSPYFNGVWYGYIATTYDRGRTWVTVNATGNDPIQRGVICTNGTTCPTGTRNLLDFNDLEVDKKGRAVAAVADGCTSAECISGVDKNNDGQLNTRFDNDGARRALIIRQASGLGLFRAFDPPPPTGGNGQVIEDNSPHVEYSNGWHMINDANASDGHFRMNNGQSPNFFARVRFNTTGQNGSITYHFARSPKGGTVEVFVDNVSKGVVNFNGTNGTKNAPEYGHFVKYDGLSEGSHVLELRNFTSSTNNNGTVYVDKFTVQNGSSNTTATAGPGATTSSTNLVGLGQELVKSLAVDSRTTEIAVMAETNTGAPIRLLLIDPSGSIQSVEATNGTAVIEKPVTQAGIYQVKVINLGVGPVQVFTATTPLVNR
jgi:hypothetical protein